MQLAGLPASLCAFCRAVWTTQVRHVEWAGCAHPEPLRAHTATAQGCPLGPLAPSLWMASGVQSVARQVGPAVAADGITRTYLDDRSFSASSASSLLSKVSAWEDFSARVGLSESPDKLQLTATSKRGLEALRDAAPDPTKVSEAFEALGVCARFKPRTNTAKEASRFDSALRIVTVLGNLRLPWDQFQREARSFGTSKAAYGWLSKVRYSE